jgi:hypothetical protein
VSERLDPGGGGLTGATGDLTPDDSDEPFVPAERREPAPADDGPDTTTRPTGEPRRGVDEISDHEERF